MSQPIRESIQPIVEKFWGMLWWKAGLAAFLSLGTVVNWAFWCFQQGFLQAFGVTSDQFTRSISESIYLAVIFGIKSYVIPVQISCVVAFVSLVIIVHPTVKFWIGKLSIKRRRNREIKEREKCRKMSRYELVEYRRLKREKKAAEKRGTIVYLTGLLSLILLTIFFFGSLYFYSEGEQGALKQIDAFNQSGYCDDRFNHSGCYRLTQTENGNSVSYNGFLVATSTSHWVLYNEKGLTIHPRQDDLIIEREPEKHKLASSQSTTK